MLVESDAAAIRSCGLSIDTGARDGHPVESRDPNAARRRAAMNSGPARTSEPA